MFINNIYHVYCLNLSNCGQLLLRNQIQVIVTVFAEIIEESNISLKFSKLF